MDREFDHYTLEEELQLKDGNCVEVGTLLRAIEDEPDSEGRLHVESVDEPNVKRIFWVNVKLLTFRYRRVPDLSPKEWATRDEDEKENWKTWKKVKDGLKEKVEGKRASGPAGLRTLHQTESKKKDSPSQEG